jgi:hypothetical protein
MDFLQNMTITRGDARIGSAVSGRDSALKCETLIVAGVAGGTTFSPVILNRPPEKQASWAAGT